MYRSHRDLTGLTHAFPTRRSSDLGALDIVDSDQLILQRKQVLQRFANQFDRDIAPHEVSMGDDPLQRSFEFTDVRTDPLGNEESRVVGQVHLRLVRLLHKDRYTSLTPGRLDGHGTPPPNTPFKTSLQAGDFLWLTDTG